MATTCSALNAPPSINAVAALTSSGARIPVLNAWQFMVDLLRSGVSVSGRRPPFGEQSEHAARVERHLADAHAEGGERGVHRFCDQSGDRDRDRLAHSLVAEQDDGRLCRLV